MKKITIVIIIFLFPNLILNAQRNGTTYQYQEGDEREPEIQEIHRSEDVDVEPFLVGCESIKQHYEKIQGLIDRNLIYPKSSIIKGSFGYFLAKFAIDESGLIRELEISGTINSEEIKNQVRFIIENLTIWKPGLKNSKAVYTKMLLSIKFEIDYKLGYSFIYADYPSNSVKFKEISKKKINEDLRKEIIPYKNYLRAKAIQKEKTLERKKTEEKKKEISKTIRSKESQLRKMKNKLDSYFYKVSNNHRNFENNKTRFDENLIRIKKKQIQFGSEIKKQTHINRERRALLYSRLRLNELQLKKDSLEEQYLILEKETLELTEEYYDNNRKIKPWKKKRLTTNVQKNDSLLALCKIKFKQHQSEQSELSEKIKLIIIPFEEYSYKVFNKSGKILVVDKLPSLHERIQKVDKKEKIKPFLSIQKFIEVELKKEIPELYPKREFGVSFGTIENRLVIKIDENGKVDDFFFYDPDNQLNSVEKMEEVLKKLFDKDLIKLIPATIEDKNISSYMAFRLVHYYKK